MKINKTIVAIGCMIVAFALNFFSFISINVMGLNGFSASMFDCIFLKSRLEKLLNSVESMGYGSSGISNIDFTSGIFQGSILMITITSFVMLVLPIALIVQSFLIKGKVKQVIGIIGSVIGGVLVLRMLISCISFSRQLSSILSSYSIEETVNIRYTWSILILWVVVWIAGVFNYARCGNIMTSKNVKHTKNSSAGKERVHTNIPPVAEKNKIIVKTYKEDRVFYGAIVGLSGIYLNKAVQMKPDERYSLLDGSCYICYDCEMNEYWIETNNRRTVFLESGQPLGAGRRYYVPRTTKIYVIDNANRFELA